MGAGEASDAALARAGVEGPVAFRAAWKPLAEALARAPERRVALAEALLTSARPDAAARVLAALVADPESGVHPASPGAPALARVLGGADYLARRAPRMAETLREICSEETLPARDSEAAHARLADLDVSGRLDRAGRGLRRNRYAELMRITARALGGASAAETTRELADLADASLASGLRAVEAAHGVAGSLAVIAMGKLGGRELNYSSDVDLLFAHGEGTVDEDRYRRLDRAITSLRSLLSETSEEGFVFRVDLDLRPEGRAGPLVHSAPALVGFYESFGRTWERVAWIRARPCAGDLRLAAQVIEDLVPFVYRRYGSYDVLQNVRDVKQRIEGEARGAGRNVKLGPGGIREAEFVVQALQALYGGRHAALRTTNTAEALSALAELGLLDPEAATTLTGAYAFLRRAENGLQMAEDRQTQELPADADGQRRLARRLGYAQADGAAAARAFVRDLETVREQVRTAFGSLLVEREVRVRSRIPEAAAWERACAAPSGFVKALMEAAPPAAAARAQPAAERLAGAAFAEASPATARLAGAPEAAPALALFLAADPELVSHLIRFPALLAAFAADGDVPFPETSDGPAPDADLETALDALRFARRDASVRAAARRLRGDLSESELERALSHAAGRVLADGLALARRHAGGSRRGGPEPARLCVLGLGKLGSEEMTFQSDLDLVFLYEPDEATPPLVAQEWAARLAQKLIHYLTTPTSAGRAYQVDMRLRPSGHGGPLVASLDAFRHYHERRAQIWEAQALLRARPVAGDAAFGAKVVETVRSALFEFLKYPELAPEIRRMRARIENERAHTGPDVLDLKYGPGGIIDAEFLAQYLALREGPRRSELRSGHTGHLIEAAGAAGLLRDAGDVLGALETLRRVETSLRLVTGRPDSSLEREGDVAALVAELVGASEIADLFASVQEAQRRLRAVFDRELRV